MPNSSPPACTWPPLPPPFDLALRDATRFLFDEVEPLGVIATGTIVRGQGDASSDLDICVIHDAPYRRRVQRFFAGVPTEIFINPPHVVRAYFAEEHRDGRLFTAHMLATGFVVHAASPVIEELRAEARQWLERPLVLSEADAVRARYGIATRLEDGADVIHPDAPTGTMLLSQAVTSMLEYFCRARVGRIPRSKELLATVAAHDPRVGQLAVAFFTAATPAERLYAAEALADLTIGTRGFFPWDSGPDPVPPPAG